MVIAETKPLVTCARDDQKTYILYEDGDLFNINCAWD